jgi:hypothetical protein
MAQINADGFGFMESATVTSSGKTLGAADCGVCQNVTATATVTLPATAALRVFTVRVGAEGITVTIAPNASDYIIGNGSSATTVNKALIFTNQPAGSIVRLASGTGGWVVSSIRGTATFAP